MSNRASPDTLVRTGKQGKIELREADLKRVAGGALYMKKDADSASPGLSDYAVAGKLDYRATTHFTTTTKGKIEDGF